LRLVVAAVVQPLAAMASWVATFSNPTWRQRTRRCP
jgi:hypothetical protein